ncbi:MAG TPA: helix-turn-helix domain-containing protein [Solirubrobacteraceae bacterium]|nr:helix-turn-helix domain-containing protein [Solirubrobacteraceae bacterium]
MAPDLPVLGSDQRERSDAARNRRKVLEAAGRLFECHGAANVSMDAIAAEAGVGKGTLFRRFGDRASLARSVLEAHERELQEGLIRGPAPLGPGAPPAERLAAFGRAYLAFLERHSDLILAAEFGSPGLRLVSPPYAFYRTHVTLLLLQAGAAEAADYLADVLLAPLSAATFRYHRDVRGLSVDELGRRYEDLCRRIVG